MILLPIGHEESGTRRLPWITFGVMLLCVAAFFLTGRGQLLADEDVELSRDMFAAFEYYVEHPYLELDPEFRALVFPEGEEGEAFQEAFGALMDLQNSPPHSSEVREAEQEVLDSLVAKALDSYEGHPFMRWGLVPADFSLVGLFTHMFLHAGWLHLIGNLLILYLAGPFIEDVWGRPLFTGFYLASGVVAALSFVALNPASDIPMVGASGAIAGVMGAFLVRYRTTRIRFFYMVGILWRGTFSAPAWVMLPLWFGEQLFFFLLTQGLSDEAGGGVAYMAHIGGFAFGFVAAQVIRAKRIEERFLHSAIESKVNRTVVDNRAVEQALQAQAEGRAEQAFEMLGQEVRSASSNQDAALAFWSVALELDRAAEAGPALLRAMQDELRAGNSTLVLDHWNELNERLPALSAEPALLLRIAAALQEDGQREEATVALRRALLGSGKKVSPAMALKIAGLARDLDAQLARGALRIALSDPGLDPSERACAEALLAELSPARRDSSIALA
jgi:membrane associated rhomboid family serine protease